MDSVFARPFVGRGNPEDWSVPPIQATPSSNAGIAAVVSLLRNDVFVYRHVERKRTPLGRSPPLRHAMRATSPASTGEHTPGRVVFRGVNTQNKKPKCKIFSCVSALIVFQICS